jgi:iron-sulfur cluster repair protein YtfE (RIC family)
MDSTELLTADHDRFRDLFARFEVAVDDGDAGVMGALASEIFDELEVHTRIEEEIFYPEVRRGSEELEDAVAEGIEEHHVADVLIDEARRLTPGEESWIAKLTVLIENVEHHADEEEQELFPAVRSAFDADVLEDQARRFEARKEQLASMPG